MGIAAAQMLENALQATPARMEVSVFLGYTAPENLTGAIKSFKPTHVLILDAADVGRKPGHIQMIDPEALTHNPSGSTHSLPFSVFANYLRSFFSCDVVILGIQPVTNEFSEVLSPQVTAAAKKLSVLITEALS